MDKLFETADFFAKNLEGKRFHFKLGKKNKLIEFDLLFLSENYKHLVGLHKLDDIPEAQRNADIVYKQILEHKTTYNDIKKSVRFNLISDRIENFYKIIDVLKVPTLMLKTNNDKFGGIRADYLMLKTEEDQGNIHLFLKQSDNGVVVPISFFKQDGFSYMKHTAKWTILSVEEISFKDKQIIRNEKNKNIENKNVNKTEDVQKSASPELLNYVSNMSNKVQIKRATTSQENEIV